MNSTVNGIDLAELSAREPRTKYGCARRVLALAAEDPGALAAHYDLFDRLLGGDNRILKWTAIDVLGKLAAAGEVERAAGVTNKLIEFLSEGNLITANHAIAALAGIAAARPELRPAITRELLAVEEHTFETGECRNIALGKVILALDSFYDGGAGGSAVLAFAGRQTGNTRNATRKKAEQFLRKHGRG